MMKLGHHAVASPIGLGMAWAMYAAGVHDNSELVCAVLVVLTSTIPDLDHPRFKGKMHFGAALVRGSAHIGYAIRTARDKDRADLHRGPTHCLEWCALFGLAVGVLVGMVPWVSQWAVWFGVACFVGSASHILADLPTPSGVPLCATYNYLRYREVWRRHTLNWFTTDSAGEKFLAVPVMFGVTVVMALGMFGLLGPLARGLTGW